jgi:hypothetical protein
MNLPSRSRSFSARKVHHTSVSRQGLAIREELCKLCLGDIQTRQGVVHFRVHGTTAATMNRVALAFLFIA